MTIKIKIRNSKKAIVRFNKQEDIDYFINTMINARDILGVHPRINLTGVDGNEIKRSKS